MRICWPAGRDNVCACVPAAVVASPVSVTVMEKAEDALEVMPFVDVEAAACADTVILRREGGPFCGRYATITLSSSGGALAAPANSARHWMKRALGLVISAFVGSAMGSDQSLQVASGRAEF